MNGRIYDPKLGRMLSPDPVTQTPENGQNYNRYTYANNNPLRYTDPSGFSYTQCGAAVAAQGGNGVANVGCAVEVYGFVETVLGAFGFGGNGCDKTCKERTAAHNWCKAQSACLAELRANTREKFRKRSAQVILEAAQTGQSYYYENGRAHLGDNTTGGTPVGQNPVVGSGKIESPQKLIARLALEVYADFPSLAKANIEAVESIFSVFGDPDGRYLGDNNIQVVYTNSSEDYLKSTILHELLHMDEAMAVADGNLLRYVLHELADGGHDDWIENFALQYGSYLLTGENKPNLDDAPRRQSQ